MKVTIKRNVDVEMDIEFPVYKAYAGFNKVISPSEYICIDNCRIEHQSNMPRVTSDILILGRDLTEDEFNEKLAEQVSKFTDILSRQNQKAFMDATDPASDADIREYETAYQIFDRNKALNQAANEL